MTPTLRVGKSQLRLLLVALWMSGSVARSVAQNTPEIEHDALQCIGVGEYPVIDAGIEPGKDVRTAKVYFRAEHFPKFYWVEMVIHDNNFISVLPKPSPDTKRIVYYIEAVDNAFNNAVDLEHDPEIVELCQEQPVYAPGDEPGIIVGATEAGAAPLPPGFEAAGIIGTVATTGLLSSGIGGGAGIGTAAAVGAAAAGAAAGVVVVTNQPPPEESTTTMVPTGVATTTMPSTPGSPTATTTVPSPSGTTTVGSTTTTTVGTATTTVSGTGTTTAPGTTTTTPGTTTTSAPTTTTTAAAALEAGCFTITPLGACRAVVDASCVALPVDRYEWRLDVNNRWKRVDIANGPVIVIQDWTSDCGSSDQSIKFRLKVHRGGDSSTSNKTMVIPGKDLRAPSDAPQRIRFQAHLELPPFDGRLRARVVVNGGDARVIDNAQPAVVESTGGAGASSVSATLMQASREPGLLRFDFSGASNVESGTLRVVRGNVVSLDDRAVVFRLSGQPAERVELTFELRR